MIRKLHLLGMNCTGCEACVQVCTQRVIVMKEDSLGFYYPQIDDAACVQCGACRDCCPVLSYGTIRNSAQPQGYAVMMEDVARRYSSSGVVFPAIAAEIIRDGGYVCGVAWE